MALPEAMSFCNVGTFEETLSIAKAYAGENGRIATLPDVLRGRMNRIENSIFWNRYFTTFSAEYYGLYQNTKPLIVVAHAVGPLSTTEGIETAYSRVKNDRDQKRNGHVTQEEFDALVDGRYGDVQVVDAEKLVGWYNEYKIDKNAEESQRNRSLYSIEQIVKNELFIARCGGLELAKAYAAAHKEFALSELVERYPQNVIEKAGVYLGKMETPSDTPYFQYTDFMTLAKEPAYKGLQDKGLAYANLLSIDSLTWTSMFGERIDQLMSDFGTHSYWHGFRFLAIRDEAGLINAREFDYDKLIKEKVPSVYEAVDQQDDRKLVALTRVGSQFFAQPPKDGVSLDSGVPKFQYLRLLHLES